MSQSFSLKLSFWITEGERFEHEAQGDVVRLWQDGEKVG